MEWKKKRRVIRHYNELADRYNSLYSSEQDLKMRLALGNVKVGNSDKILDVGCGSGLLLEHIREPVNLLVGLDISSELLRTAKARAERVPQSSVSLICADADSLPFSNEVFNKVFAVTLLQNMPNPNVSLREMLRVSRKDAAMVVTALKKSFSEEQFAKVLSEAPLKFSILDTDERIRCHIAICRKNDSAKDKNK